jgi:hypothetical protein
MRDKYPLGFYSFCLIYLLLIGALGNLIPRYSSFELVSTYSVAFLIYLLIYQERNSFYLLFGIGLGARLIMFFSMPSLSDDIYRFLWDGILIRTGQHPFEHLPGYFLDKGIEGISIELFNKLNSPEYFTIYPPTNQFFFWLAVSIGQNDWIASTNVIRLFILSAEVGSFFLLSRLLAQLNRHKHLVFLYFLNPLVILEFTGNVHFEAFVILFLLLGIYFFVENKKILSGVGFGLAAGFKLLPFIFFPSIFFHGLKTRKWSIAVFSGIVALLAIVPMLNAPFIHGMQESLGLYFQKFEFNASIYYISRSVGFWITGYNEIALIGPILSGTSAFLIILVSFIGMQRKWNLPFTMLLVLMIYLAFATTIHPWYILPLIPLGIISGWFFPLAWSFLIFLTYLGYNETGFDLPLYIVIIEYSILAVFIIFESMYRIRDYEN